MGRPKKKLTETPKRHVVGYEPVEPPSNSSKSKGTKAPEATRPPKTPATDDERPFAITASDTNASRSNVWSSTIDQGEATHTISDPASTVDPTQASKEASSSTRAIKDDSTGKEPETSSATEKIAKSGAITNNVDASLDEAEFSGEPTSIGLKARSADGGAFKDVIEANHFKIEVKSPYLHRYSCSEDIRREDSPRTDVENATSSDKQQQEKKIPARIRRRIFVLLVKQLLEKYKIRFATNYKNQLVATSPIPNFDAEEGIEEKIVYYDEDQFADDSRLTSFFVHIKSHTSIDTSNVVRHLQGRQPAPNAYFQSAAAANAAVDQTTDALNLIFSDFTNSNTVRYAYRLNTSGNSIGQEPNTTFIGANKFYEIERLRLPPAAPRGFMNLNRVNADEYVQPPWQLSSQDMERGLYAMIGCFRSVRAVSGSGFVLNVNAVTGCFYQNLRLSALMKAYRAKIESLASLEKFISGLRVRTTHMSTDSDLQLKAKEAGTHLRERIFTISGLPYTEDLLTRSDWSNYKFRGPKDVRFALRSDHKDVDSKQGSTTKPGASHQAKAGTITLFDYWQKRNRLDADEFVVRIGQRDRAVFLPASCLEVLPGQNFKGRTEIVKEACRRPKDNFAFIKGRGRTILGALDPGNILHTERHFNARLEDGLIKPLAYLFPKPIPQYQNGPAEFQDPSKTSGQGRSNPDVSTRGGQGRRRNNQRGHSQGGPGRSGFSTGRDGNRNFSSNSNTTTEATGATERAKWNLKRLKLYTTPTRRVKYAAMQVFSNRYGFDTQKYLALDDLLNTHSQKLGFIGLENVLPGEKPFENKHKHALWVWSPQDDDEEKEQENVEVITKCLTGAKTKGAEIVFLYLEETSDKVYAAIKSIADQVVGIPTICIKQSNNGFKKNTDDLAANLLLKLNAKVRGPNINHTIESLLPGAERPKLLKPKTMIVGLDVTHPGQGAMLEAPSVAAMVASFENFHCHYPATYTLNPLKEEIDAKGNRKKKSNEQVIHIGSMLINRLEVWKAKNNGTWPEQIVLYRDGLSEGQFEMCKNQEIRSMKAALSKKFADDPDKCPKLLVVCTVKRNHCRFNGINKNSKMVDKNGNAASGTVVYDDVTRGDGNDFFLVSHTAIMGTARPMHYVVLHNEISDITLKDIAQATYDLCFTWARSTSAVGLVPASRYADKACDRARCYLYKLYHGWKKDDPTVFAGFNPQSPRYHEHRTLAPLQVHADVEDRMLFI